MLQTEWLDAAIATNDYIVKAKIADLTPGTDYLYRVVYGVDPDHTETGPTRSFATHPRGGRRSRDELYRRHRHELLPVL